MTTSRRLRDSLKPFLTTALALTLAQGCGGSGPHTTTTGGDTGGNGGDSGSSGNAGGNGGASGHGGGSGSNGAGGNGGNGAGGNGAGSNGAGGNAGNGAGGDGTGGNAGNGAGGNGTGGNAGAGGAGGSMPPPPAACNAAAADAQADVLNFANNLIASPSPPGNLAVANTPQIVVFGFDDVESTEGVTFVNGLLGGVTNPNGSKASLTFNPNACYLGSSQDMCGNGSLYGNASMVTQNKFGFGNHTIDHLESNSVWPMIPQQWKDPDAGGWKFTMDGFGPGIAMDQMTWEFVLGANDSELKNLLGVNKIDGFRAPRLEVNDAGLNALKKFGYFDENLEETLPEGHVDAVTMTDTANKKGFNWIPWPYTLDNGSPGVWNQQWDGGDPYITNFPQGVWEVPVYQAYVPASSGLGKMIADRMLYSDTHCMFPDTVPADQRKHCFLGDGELSPGDVVKEITGFDFNLFIYSRLKADEWLTVMKHSFLVRYYGNRAPLTYGAHPIEYTGPYDSETLGTQANNYGFRDVLTFSTYTARQQAMKSFVQWIKSDPVLSKDTYFMSAQQLVAYMTAPFDKTGAKVAADAVAMPDSNGVFTRLKWTTDNATIKVIDGNSADVQFMVGAPDGPPVSVSAGVTAGSLKGVSHIDIKYSSDVPIRLRLLTPDTDTPSTTVLLAGTGTTDRVARIRVKDFFIGPEAPSDAASAATLVDANYMAKVVGIGIESAHTAVTGGNKTFTAHIKQLTLHGVATSALCK